MSWVAIILWLLVNMPSIIAAIKNLLDLIKSIPKLHEETEMQLLAFKAGKKEMFRAQLSGFIRDPRLTRAEKRKHVHTIVERTASETLVLINRRA